MRITRIALFILNLAILPLLTARDAETKLIIDTLSHDMDPGLLGIDFSEARIDPISAEVLRTGDWGNYDVVWTYWPEAAFLFFGQLLWLEKIADLSEIKIAPEKGYKEDAPAYSWYLDQFVGNMTYVCITQEGHYVKFQCAYDVSDRVEVITIHYVYQTDGSRNLDESTLVKPSTWGGIKSLLKKGGE